MDNIVIHEKTIHKHGKYFLKDSKEQD